jgi:glutamine synthetase
MMAKPASGFVERHGLWTEAQARAAQSVEQRIAEEGLEVVRFAFADQHGVPRGKALIGGEAAAAMRDGVHMVSTVLLKDTSGRTAWPVFTKGAGAAAAGGMDDFQSASDVVLVADPTTFHVLPWADKTGWMLCNAYFTDGRPVPFDTRAQMQRALARLAKAGFNYVAGLEVEFHVFKVENPRLALSDGGWPGEPPEVSLLQTGYQLLTEQRYEQMEPALALLRRDLLKMGMPLRSMEIELGPSQCEFVFGTGSGIAPADMMVLFRNAAKQVLRRNGYHASFMCRPKIPHVMSSGWHLHQSLADPKSRRNLFMPEPGAAQRGSAANYLSQTGTHYLAGLLAHAQGAAAFTTPTINGYRRYRPNSLAPDRAIWGSDNRGAMVRVVGAAGDATSRVENRVGEPAANPYLYMASQIFAGLDGIAHQRDPGLSADVPYETNAPRLPTSLPEALAALADSACMREGFGDGFVDYFMHIKQAELARFNAEVTEWEQREYFDIY